MASGVAIVATLAFVFIALPTEELYVNLAAAALCGGALGFFPYNISKRWRIFMGDGGSLLLGFICSSLALGTSYGKDTEWGVFAPLMILCLPIYDTLLVFAKRILRGSSPFLGSKDHFALRLEMLGWRRPWILVFSIFLTMLLSFGAFLVTRVPSQTSFLIYAATFMLIALFTGFVNRAKID
jgi:UDP-GlcNAc:undecaprenyl-phosphate GlcNAc-1-phosphate transferase